MNFPHLDDTAFPHLNTVDVYKHHVDFDYMRYDNVQMIIRVLNVPWDLGEVHVGNRTVGGIGNVVKFESDAARDAWFNSKRYAETPEQAASGNYDGFVWRTKYREFHDEDEIEIELPFDVAARYNYITIEYVPAPDSDYPVNYESERGLLKWFYFSRAVESLAVNCTRCILRRDTWSTYINRISIPYMMLDRGHAPMAKAASADVYLANPLANTRYLLAPDVDYNAGESRRVASSNNIVLNAEAYYACIVTTANPRGNFGTAAASTWITPANVLNNTQGQPSANVFAIRANRLNAFLNNINSNIPQFIQTVQAVFFASRELVTLGTEFTFGGETCNWLVEKNNRKSLVSLNKAAFGYGSKYANIAKLYTYPYAQIVISDDKGNTRIVNVEETSGTINLDFKLSFAYPWLNIEGHLLGIGNATIGNIEFSNLSAHSFAFGGAWYEHLRVWNIPTFALTQSAHDVADYSTFYDREQSYLENETQNTDALQTNATANTNALASNDTANTNALASNATTKTNEDATADMSVTNTAVQNATNSYLVNRQNYYTVQGTLTDQGYNFASADIANDVTLETTNNEVDAAYAGAAISGIGGVLSSAASGAAGGVALGPAGIAGGAIAGAIGGVIGGISGQMQTAVSNNLLESQATVQRNANNAGVELTNTTSGTKTGQQTSLNTISVDTQNENNTTQTANNAGLMKANATRTQNTNDANANREKATADANANREKATADANANREKTTNDAIANRDKTTADAGVVAAFNQASLAAPYTYGSYDAGDTSTTRPMGMFASVVTQPIDAIEQAGDYFLKYGYAYKGNWNFETFNVMPKFSYWRCDDLTVRGLDVPDLYMDEIRFFLLGGVTVWRVPEDIGNVSIYENEV